MKVFIDDRANKELCQFSLLIQVKFKALFKLLKLKGRLEFPDSKKLDKKLYEIRVKFQGEYRGFYAYIQKNSAIILHCFQKKTQKTPLKNLKTARRRLKFYE
ncbi:type II toxin-antitoxin system RelE/ParE family toxin [Patescibacteria group bacterium]|nr:type II toxin-antitoxin system RelE/ParE family toxin [Patescibacteria group bacterium]